MGSEPVVAQARARFVRGLVLWVFLSCAGLPATAQETNPTTASTAIYVRNDNDRTTVVTPRLHVGVPVAEESRLDVIYTVDVWSSASIDIRTAATKRVVEQRDELDVSGEHRLGDATLGGSYRYSTENDYESHGGSLGVSQELANKSATAALTVKAYFDRVGKAGDPDFDKPTTLYSARASLTQLLSPDAYVQGVYELTRQSGFLSSPYRFVRFATLDDAPMSTCALPVSMCPPEKNPDSRLRHALALSGRYALSWDISVGASYRFYLDDWEMTSHTVGVDGALTLDEGWLVALGYRFYTQGAADHYATYYVASDDNPYYTSDKELSPLQTHRLDLELSRLWTLDELGSQLKTVLLVAPGFYTYSDFPGLDSISALELTLSVEARL